jgi:hypothetical protein
MAVDALLSGRCTPPPPCRTPLESSPVASLSPPRSERERIVPLSVAQVHALADAALTAYGLRPLLAGIWRGRRVVRRRHVKFHHPGQKKANFANEWLTRMIKPCRRTGQQGHDRVFVVAGRI